MPATIIAAYDAQAIWGVGMSVDAAIEDAAQWVDAASADRMRASLKTAPMSDRLTKHVACAGGNCPFELDEEGVLRLCTND